MRSIADPQPSSSIDEQELLVACARAHPDAIAAERIRTAARRDIDWQRLVELARWHRLLPLLHRNLDRWAPDLVPDEALAGLRARAATSAARSLFLTAELRELTWLFEAHGIRSLPFKGPMLAQSAYGDLALRQLKDLDILVGRGDVARAGDLLRRRGYAPTVEPLPGAIAYPFEYQLCFVREADDAMVELHWTVAPRDVMRPVGLAELWPRVEQVTLAGAALAAPSLDDLFLILAVHGAKHRWHRLEMIAALTEMLRESPIDWEAVRARAARWRVRRMLRTALRLAGMLLAAPVPDALALDSSHDALAVDLAEQARRRMFDTADVDELSLDRERHTFQRLSLDTLGDRLRYRWYRPLIRWERRAATLANAAGLV